MRGEGGSLQQISRTGLCIRILQLTFMQMQVAELHLQTAKGTVTHPGMGPEIACLKGRKKQSPS